MIPIAFGHAKRVGKDTAARFLLSHLRINHRGSNIKVAGFADKIKDICYSLYSWAGLQTGSYYEEYQLEKELILPKLNKSPRTIWIEMGTTVGRAIFRTTWSDYLFNNCKCDILIISDLRFPNEADQIHAYGGLVYKIERPDVEHTSDIADDALIGYDKFDSIIVNDGSLADFHQKICILADELLLKIKKD